MKSCPPNLSLSPYNHKVTFLPKLQAFLKPHKSGHLKQVVCNCRCKTKLPSKLVENVGKNTIPLIAKLTILITAKFHWQKLTEIKLEHMAYINNNVVQFEIYTEEGMSRLSC